MSKIKRPSKTGSKSSISQPGTSTRASRTSATNVAGATAKTADASKKPKKPEKKTIEFQLPPLSVVGKKREIDFEEIRKKVIRRSNPEGEDKKELASILKHLRDSKAKIKVHEFVNLVARFTSDNGEALRKILEDDLATFRKTVTKVYETMTQDVSDVLVNEQIQTTTFYQEKYDMLNERMLWMISQIFQMIPEFDFERYAKDKEDFLNLVAPLPTVIIRAAADIDNQRRQEAFHRLQWLKIEGGRLNDENKRLEKRLNDLREELDRNQAKANLKAKIMKNRKDDLEMQEHAKKEHLHELEGILAKTAVRAEAYVRLEEDEAIRLAKERPKAAVVKKTTKKKVKRPEWSSVTAADLEAATAQQILETEGAAVDQKKRQKLKEKEVKFGPNATRSAVSEDSGLSSASRMQEKKIQQTTTTVQEKREIKRSGRYRAPKDTWGGFQ